MQLPSSSMRKAADQLVAHRGYAARYVENSIPALQAALECGARFLEVDVQLSADRQPMLFHDRDLLRLCAQPGPLHDYSQEQLQHMSLRSAQQPFDPDARVNIPQLSDLVHLMQRWPEATVFVELKRLSLAQFGIADMVDRVLQQLHEIEAQCVMISYSLEALQYLRQVSSLPVGIVVDDWAQRRQVAIEALQAQYLFCDIDSLTASGMLAFGTTRIVVFECTDVQRAHEVLARGVSLVETFEIGDMLSAL